MRRTPQRPSRRAGDTAGTSRIDVKNVNVPGKSRSVDALHYRAVRRAVLKVLPRRAPGLTIAELFRAMLPQLPANLFPGGAKAGWWMKTVQLDLEARRIIAREKTTPLRLHKL